MSGRASFSLLSPFFLSLFLSAETFQIMKQTRAHEGSVFTLCVLQGGALLSGGGKDRRIIRWSADLAPERECEVKCVCVLMPLWGPHFCLKKKKKTFLIRIIQMASQGQNCRNFYTCNAICMILTRKGFVFFSTKIKRAKQVFVLLLK